MRTAGSSETAGPAETGSAAVLLLVLALCVPAQPGESPVLERRAAPIQTFLDRMEPLSGPSTQSVEEVERLLVRLDPERLGQGMIAHCAAVTAEAPSFARMMKAAVAADGRPTVLARLRRPGEAMRLWAGAGPAVQALLDRIDADSRAVLTAQGHVEAHARTLLRGERHAEEGLHLHMARIDRPRRKTGSYVAKRGRTMIDAILRLAGLAHLDALSGGDLDRLSREYSTLRCVRIAHVTLKQCLSTVHGEGERAFCLGRHGLGEVAACWRRGLLETSANGE